MLPPVEPAAARQGWRAPTLLGATGLRASRIGLGSSYGLDQRGVERAFERGLNYFYWGSRRRDSFGRGISAVAARARDRMVVCVQTYARIGALLGPSLRGALRRLKLEYADLLLLGLWNEPPPPRIVDAALALVEQGLARHLMVSCHRRATFARYFADPRFEVVMLRYSAAHPGAEQDVFPHVGAARTGIVGYTATCWGRLLDPAHVPSGERVPSAADCYRFALSEPRVHVCLAGPRDEAELEAAFQALERGPMDADELAWMKRVGLRARSPLLGGR